MAEAHRDEIAKLEALYASNPEGRVFTHLAEAYRKAGEADRALQILTEGMRRHPDSASAYVVLGRVLSDSGDAPGGFDAFKRALELDTGNLVALRWCGDLAMRAGRVDDALGYYHELMARDPSDANLRDRVAIIEADRATAMTAVSAPPMDDMHLAAPVAEAPAAPSHPTPEPAEYGEITLDEITPHGEEYDPSDLPGDLAAFAGKQIETRTGKSWTPPAGEPKTAEETADDEMLAEAGLTDLADIGGLDSGILDLPASSSFDAEEYGDFGTLDLGGAETADEGAADLGSLDLGAGAVDSAPGIAFESEGGSHFEPEAASAFEAEPAAAFDLDAPAPFDLDAPAPFDLDAPAPFEPATGFDAADAAHDELVFDTPADAGEEAANPFIADVAPVEEPIAEPAPWEDSTISQAPAPWQHDATSGDDAPSADDALSFDAAPSFDPEPAFAAEPSFDAPLDEGGFSDALGAPPVGAPLAGAAAPVTETMAELYRNQGFPDRAADVYRQLIRERGGDERLEQRLAEVEAELMTPSAAASDALLMDQDESGEMWLRDAESPWVAPAEGGDGHDSPYAWSGEGEELASNAPPIASYFQSLLQWRPASPGTNGAEEAYDDVLLLDDDTGTDTQAVAPEVDAPWGGSADEPTSHTEMLLTEETAVPAAEPMPWDNAPASPAAAPMPWDSPAESAAPAAAAPQTPAPAAPAAPPAELMPWETAPSAAITPPETTAANSGTAAPAWNAADAAGAASNQETSEGFSAWYESEGGTGGGPSGPVQGGAPEEAEDDEDLEMFRTWLQSLKK